MDKVTGARTPLTTPSPSRSLDSGWIMDRENDIFFLEIPPSSSVSSSPPLSSPVGSWSSTTALRVGRADKERFYSCFFSPTFLSIFTALLVGRADEEHFETFL